MPKYNMAFSLNRQIDIEADSYAQAEQKLQSVLKSEGIDVNDENCNYSLEVFDVYEPDEIGE